METVNNIAKAAANAVWGENTNTGNTTTGTTGTEPVSGQRGNTSAGEPYDKGNLEEPNSTTSTTGLSSTGDSTNQGLGGSSVGGFSSGLPDRSATHGVPSTSEGAHSTTGGLPTHDHHTSGSTSSGVPGSNATTVTGEPHPLSGNHSSTTGTTGGLTGTTEGNHGPHDSKAANTLDPRVDSDRDGSRTVGNTGNTGSTTTGTTGGYSSGTTEGSHGPHGSKVANAADPRVDSDRDGSRTTGNTGSTTGTTGGYSSGTTEGSHGPHNSKVANAADPRVDSDRDGSRTAGNTGSHTGHHDNANFAKTTGTAAESDNVPDNKYTERKAHDTPADTSKGQNDTRDPSDPATNPKNNPTDVDDTTSGPNKGQELGPGPKSLTEVAKEHGGDAGNTGTTTSTGDDKSKDKSAETDDPNDPRAPSHGEGTGEKYIKSSGLAADGGDFDASNAGAGREADRLLEEKGIHRDPGQPPQETGAAGDDTTEKKSLKDKIKEKLHRN